MVPYFQNEEEDDLSLLREFTEVFESVGIGCKTTVEMGRYFAAECGFYLTAVNDTKLIKKQRIAVLDGGIHQLSYSGGAMGMFTPRFELIKADGEARERNEWMLCGSLCTTSDILVRSCETEELRESDILVFKNAGAYCMTEGLSLFLSRDLPRVALYKDGQFVVKREPTDTYPLNH